MTRLLLHVGHSKTGTTWIQAGAALSRQALEAHGILYPSFGQERDPASNHVELGNASAGALSLDAFRATLDRIGPPAGRRGVLLSSEELFVQLNALADAEGIVSAAHAAGYEGIGILLFIRDPMEHAASLWQQYLKRGGGSAGVEEFFRKYAVPGRVAGFLDIHAGHPAISVTLRNYSRHTDRLMGVVSDWLDVPPGIWKSPPAARLNRSLTAGEVAFQRALNRHLGRAGVLLSDALCERLPHLRPTDIRPSREVQEETWRRLGPDMARVDARAAPQDRYCHDVREGDDDAGPALSAAQIEVVADAMGAEIRRLRLLLASRAAPFWDDG